MSDDHSKPQLCPACERVKKVCERAELQIREQTGIQQGGHINTLQIRAALAGEMDPWESDILKQTLADFDLIEKAVQDKNKSDAEVREYVRSIINEEHWNHE